MPSIHGKYSLYTRVIILMHACIEACIEILMFMSINGNIRVGRKYMRSFMRLAYIRADSTSERKRDNATINGIINGYFTFGGISICYGRSVGVIKPVTNSCKLGQYPSDQSQVKEKK